MRLPSYLQIEPVGQCNLRCQMCPIQFRQDGPPHGPLAFMAWETFTRLIDGFPTLERLHLQGLGEPMMHPRFFDMVAYAVARNIWVSTNTNFTLLNAHRAEQLVTSGLDELHISIDGAVAATYERIRRGARFERILRNLALLLEARQRLAGNRQLYTGPRLQMVMVIMRQNLEELPDLVRFAHRWRMDSIFVQHLCHDFGESTLPARYQPMRDFVEEQSLLEEDPERIERTFGQARAVAQEVGIDLRLPRTRPRAQPPATSPPTPGRQRCDWPWTGAYISYQGYAMPCCMVSTPDRVNMGNVARMDVEAIWNGPAYQEFRGQLESDHPPEICRSCSIYRGTF